MEEVKEYINDYPKKIVVTPINTLRPSTINGKKARIDYLREKKNSEDFTLNSVKWDDSRHGTGEPGDLFAFVHNIRDEMEIFIIKEKINYIDRPDYWDIVEHQRRDVLILSKKIFTIKWSTYKRIHGYKENFILRGTERFNFIRYE